MAAGAVGLAAVDALPSASAAADFGSAVARGGRGASSWMMAGRLDSSLALANQPAKPGSWRWCVWNSRTIIMRSHSGIGTRTWRPPPSRNLRNACAVWFLRLGGKSDARSMKHCLAPMAGSTLSSWRFKPPPCVGRLQMKTRPSVVRPPLCFSVKSRTERSSPSSRRSTLSSMAPAHSSLASVERAGEDVEQLALVGGDFGFRRVLEALPQLAVVDGRRPESSPDRRQSRGRGPRQAAR